MKNFEREFLNYKPILGYKPDIDWIRTATGQEISDSLLPSELQDANSILAADLLQGAFEVKDSLEDLIGQVEQCLNSKQLPGPCQFSDYQKAIAEGNTELVSQFDDFHRTSLEGSVQAELYPTLLYVYEEADGYTRRVAETFFGNPDLKPEYLNKLRKEENDALNMRVVEAVNNPDKLDRESLALEAKMKLGAKERIEGLQKFVKDTVAVMSSTANERFNGKIKDVVKVMAAAPSGNLDIVQDMSSVRMGVLGAESNNIHVRLKSIGNNQLRDRLDGTVNRLKELHLDKARRLTDWLMDIVEQDPGQDMVELVETNLASMEEISHSLDHSVLEVMKMNKLDELNRKDLIANLMAKKITRQINRLAKGIQEHMDLEDPNRDRQIKRFIENMELEKPGDICSD